MEKIPCSDCGALILPTTAASTGGLCMACKQGIRKSMEASRAYYARQKVYDPMRALWTSLVGRSSDDPDLTSWSRQESLYFAMRLLEGEVYNGGFDQYFHNSSADYYRLAVEGLEEIGALRSLELVRAAAHTVFGDEDPPGTSADRRQIMKAEAGASSGVVSEEQRASHLDRLDKAFWTDPDNLGDRLTAYADQHGLVRPFERDPD